MNEALRVAQFSSLELKPLTPTIGVEIHSIDLSRPLTTALLGELRAALLAWKVVFFRGQTITTEQHLAFARNFGDLEVHPFAPQSPATPRCSLSSTIATTRGKKTLGTAM